MPMRVPHVALSLEDARLRGGCKSAGVAFCPPKDWRTRNLVALQIGQLSLKTPAAPSSPGTLLLPTSDAFARVLARQREDYMAAGWRVLIGSPSSVDEIGNKVRLQRFARKHHLTPYLPTNFSVDTARFPCIAKKGRGEYGRRVHLVETRDALRAVVGHTPASWLIQELVPGNEEIATTLVVVDGVVKASMRTCYTYRDEVYVWPETAETKRASNELPDAERVQLEPFVRFFTGVCNFNYKVRTDGRVAVFEINPRVGADFCDAKVSLARRIVDAASKYARCPARARG